MIDVNTAVVGVCPEILSLISDSSVDLTITSPPYDNLRKYEGKSSFDFENTAKELYRLTKSGGVVVWVVADQTIRGSETLTSFKQAIYFKEVCGFRIHDTMIFGKNNPTPMNHNRYEQQFEYMFVLSKGRPKMFDGLRVPISSPRSMRVDRHHEKNYKRGNSSRGHTKDKLKGNVWFYGVGCNVSSKDRESFAHPATFPELLCHDHILTWSEKDDLVLDPFCGSGTTLKMALLTERRFIGIDSSEEYVRLTRDRLEKYRLKDRPGPATVSTSRT